MRRNLIAGNWKMNTDIQSTGNLIKSIKELIGNQELKSEILVCPPFTNLQIAVSESEGSSIKVGGQNCDFHTSGAYTGEISIDMLKSVGCSYVIIGHSERRTYYYETDETVNFKLKAALSGGITPIICIGETIEERNAGKTYDILERQIRGAYNDLSEDDLASVVIAYEPVWAIGTGVSATTEQAGDAHSKIRKFILDNYGHKPASIRILYGGSMNDKNSGELLALEDVDGGLIGGASLKAEAFYSIIKSSEENS
ncbi:MAG: triose-phosphate isomerase [Candidatus Kapabacteria bacterium]|nr:triose-phosphate isomerase [Ignavibacteriota bacterium]MCW5884476.1 triose-phosphate isomerase [Candidatus Kapabacteria bacterium]